jgi:hypothetical protein
MRTQIEGLGQGLDVKGDGGYVVAPPSYHATFRHYRWRDPTAAIEDLPQWLLDLRTQPRAAHSAAIAVATESSWQKAGQDINEGARNVTF